MSLSFRSADVLTLQPDSSSSNPLTRSIIFFLPGNPGLLGYYLEFLSLLSAAAPCSQCTIAGFSLGGFDVSPSKSPDSIASIQCPPGSSTGPLYSLQDQIILTHCRIDALVQALSRNDGARYNVILIGHSVGAYIALEVIRRLHEERSEQDAPSYAISGAILLTPTVVDIAKSSHGKLVTPLLTYAPFLDVLAQWAVWGLLRTLPGSLLEGLVGKVTGMKGEKLQTTLHWLRSESGVKQTIYMGRQEMQQMGDDQWGDEIWGAAKETPKLVLYFARTDHWVGDVTRDELSKARRKADADGKDTSWPRIEIEASGEMVHGWCIDQSKEVAARAVTWIEEMIEGDHDQLRC